MENSNRPVQRVIPLRAEFQPRSESGVNCESSTNIADIQNQFKPINVGPTSIIDSAPFVQQNVNIMNINLPNNAIIQGVSQSPGNNFPQTSGSPKTYLQLADGRYVQIAQNIQQTQQQMPTTILVQMPYKLVDQPGQNVNQAIINKRFLLPSKGNEKSPQNSRFINVGNTVNAFVSNSQTGVFNKVGDSQVPQQLELQTQSVNEFQRNMFSQLKEVKDQVPNSNSSQVAATINGNIISLEKYQEICDMLQEKKLLVKTFGNEEMVLVEFRLNQQKYQLRMTRNQKVDMEKLLISAGNQQRQMEILQVYQSEQRKNMQQRTSVVLNQIINKNTSNIICNSPQLQTLNLTKPMYPLNSVLLAVSQNQFNDPSLMQSSNSNNQPKNISIQSTASVTNPNGMIFTSRTPIAQSSIMSVPTILRDATKDLAKQKRIVKTPVTSLSNVNSTVTSNQDMKPARARRYNNMRKVLSEDQTAVKTPSYSTPFEDLNDVARRLVPYHILEECKEQRFDEVDKIIANSFSELKKRCTNLKRIASSMTTRDMIMDKNEERLLIKRMQLDLERDVFEREKISQKDDNFEDIGDTVIVIEDSPPPTVESDVKNIDDDTNCTLTQTVPNTISFVESIEDSSAITDDIDITQPVFDNDNFLDSIYNYDIQDISNDGDDEPPSLGDLDWKEDNLQQVTSPHISVTTPRQATITTSSTIAHSEDDQQSQDPDLDAAIKSILF